MSAFQRIVYNTLFKKTGNYVGFIVAGAIAVELTVDKGIELAWDLHNKGVRFRNKNHARNLTTNFLPQNSTFQ